MTQECKKHFDSECAACVDRAQSNSFNISLLTLAALVLAVLLIYCKYLK